jgi:hypothetical protein
VHIAFGEHFIEISRWESRTQMIRYLGEGCAAGSILLGEDAEMATEFYTATLYLGARASRFGIGICSEGHGLTPQMLLLAEEGTLMFGFNREVVALSIMDMEIERCSADARTNPANTTPLAERMSEHSHSGGTTKMKASDLMKSVRKHIISTEVWKSHVAPYLEPFEWSDPWMAPFPKLPW